MEFESVGAKPLTLPFASLWGPPSPAGRGVLAQLNTRQGPLGAPLGQQLEEPERPGAVHVGEEAAAVSRGPLRIVVAGGALGVEALAGAGEAVNFLVICLLGLGGRLQPGGGLLWRLGDHVGDVVGLFVQGLGH